MDVTTLILNISAEKLLPSYLHAITSAIYTLGGNVEKFDRQSIHPLSLNIHVSGVSESEMSKAISHLETHIQSMVSVL
jgi:hypothetical protein